MKRWAFLTVLIYTLALILLAVPVIVIAFSGTHLFSIKQAATVYQEWAYWLWLVVLVGGQALLLLLPINVAEKRLPARRNLKIPAIVGGFFLGMLALAGLLSVLCAIYGDKIGSTSSAVTAFLSVMVMFLFFWLVWMVIFRRVASNDDPDALIQRATRWLLRGSILELLVAVPSHVIVRRRDDCCAPIMTFGGIVTGISVMFLCFGPGVFFLFVERFRRLKPTKDSNR